MKLACTTAVFRNELPEEAFGLVAAAGFKYIELASVHCDYNTLTNALIDATMYAIDRAGLKVLTYYADNTREHWTRMPRMFEVARRVGAKHVVMSCANLGAAKQLEPSSTRTDIDIAIVNRWPDPFGRPGDFKSINGGVSQRIGVAADVGWFVAGGQNPLDLFDITPDRVKVVRVSDIAKRGEIRGVDLGSGVANLDGVFKTLTKRKFTGPVTVDRLLGRVITFQTEADGWVVPHVDDQPIERKEALTALRRARKWMLAHGAIE